MKLSRLTTADIDATFSFWRESQESGPSAFDSKERFEAFLNRNPGLSFKITDRDKIVGTVLCGHDGRRGYLHHIAVAEGYPKLDVGRTMIDRSLKALGEIPISRCHVFIDPGNTWNLDFWQSIDWKATGELVIFSHDIEYPTH